MRCLIPLLLLALVACDDGPSAVTPDRGSTDLGPADLGPDAARWVLPDAGPDAAPPDAEPPDDPTASVYDPDRLVVVSVEMDPDDWDRLRGQVRAPLDFTGAECLDAPFPSPYTWFAARVTIDGETYDDVGVRKKGFVGSVTSSRPSLKLKFDKYVDNQRHRTMKRLTLNNSRQDPARLRTCLAYQVFREAGLPAPRCNLAQVFVNGRPMGVYANVEPLKKPWLRQHFADDSGHLYEGTLSDFRPEFRGTLEQKTDEDTPHPAPINRLIAAAAADDAALIEAVAAALDLERFLRFWAVEVLVAHWDGYAGNTNNFWFYDDPTSGKAVFIPWGPDATFGPAYLLFERLPAPASVFATGILTRRLYDHPEGRRRYLAALRAVLAEAWDPDALLDRVDRWAALTEAATLPEGRARRAEALDEIRGFIERRARRIEAELAEPIEWTVPVRDSLCRVPVGQATFTFETTWGTWPTDDTFATGQGSVDATLRDTPLPAEAVGAAIGPEDGRAVLIQPIWHPAVGLRFVYVAFELANVRPGEVRLGRDDLDCTLNDYDPDSGQVTRVAECYGAVFTFDAAGLEPGQAVRGTVSMDLWGPPRGD